MHGFFNLAEVYGIEFLLESLYSIPQLLNQHIDLPTIKIIDFSLISPCLVSLDHSVEVT